MIRNSARQFLPGIAIISLFATMVGSASVASATPIVDQSFVSPHNLGGNINEGFDLVAQSFIAGVTGDLVGVRVDIQSTKSSLLRISIYDMLGSTPNNLLRVTSLGTAQSLIGDTIALPTPLSVVAGSKYVIAADYPGIPPGAGQVQGIWAGASGDVYTSGNGFLGNFISGDSGPVSWLPGTFDFHFQTLVTPVPEPATWILCAVGLVSLAVFGRRLRGRRGSESGVSQSAEN